MEVYFHILCSVSVATCITRAPHRTSKAHQLHSSAELLWPVVGNFAAYMRQTGVHQFPKHAGQLGAFEFCFGQPIFEFFENHESEKANFDHYFEIRNYGRKEAWFDTYPIGEIIEASSQTKSNANEVLIVDVGGGRGQDLVRLAERYPKARDAGRMIVQDLPSTIEKLPVLLHNIEAMPHNFFRPQPIQGTLIGDHS